MTLKKTKKIFVTSLFLTLLLGLGSVAQAQNAQFNGDAVLYQLQQSNSYWANLPALLQKTVGGALNEISGWLFEEVPGIGKTIASTSSVKTVLADQEALTTSTTTQLSNLFLGVSTSQNNMALQNNMQSPMAKLNANNFLSPANYQDSQFTSAENYIGYASGAHIAITPSTQINFGADSNSKQKYQDSYDTLAAIQSLSAYNLSTLYAERVGIPTKDIKSLGDSKETTISPEQLFQYLAMQKATDPNWYKQMAVASPFTSIRELLNFAAGGFMELYRMEKTQEQILATLSELNTLMVMQQSRELSKTSG